MGSARGGDASRILPCAAALANITYTHLPCRGRGRIPFGGFGMPCAGGAQEDRPRPSCESPLPKEVEERLPLLLYPLGYNLMYGSEALFNGG